MSSSDFGGATKMKVYGVNEDLRAQLPIYGIVQFVELKDGQVHDFTMHGGGYDKEIER